MTMCRACKAPIRRNPPQTAGPWFADNLYGIFCASDYVRGFHFPVVGREELLEARDELELLERDLRAG